MDTNKIESIYPLAPQQKGVFLESRAASGSGLHIEQEIHTLEGPLDVIALERAWQRVVGRHAMLRTAFVWKGQDQPLQVVLRNVSVQIEQQDARHLCAEAQGEFLEEFLAADRQRGFELSRPPLARLTLLRTGENSYEFIRTFHHILIDGWSIPILTQDLLRFYASFQNGGIAVVEPASSYRDYVMWLKRQDTALAETYWRKALGGWQRPTPIGRIANRPAHTDEPQTYGYADARLTERATESLRLLARRGRLTLNTILQGAWALLLSGYSGERDVVFGTTVSGRPIDLSGVETTIGLFVNTLPFRVKIETEKSLVSWLESVQAEHLELRQFEYCSTGQIHPWSDMPATVPLFESAIVFENYPEASPLPGATGLVLQDIRKSRVIGAQTKFAVTLLVTAHEELLLHMVYDRRRFDGDAAARVLEHFTMLLGRLAADPECPLHTLLSLVPEDQIPDFRPLQPPDRDSDAEGGAPRTPTEAILADIWREVLGLPHVGVFENLLELGAHSLIATQVVARIRSVLKIELPLSAIFDSPTIAGLALKLPALQLNSGPTNLTALQPAIRNRALPLSFAQQRLWLLDQLDPGLALYNSSARIKLVGSLDRMALGRSLNEILLRHEALRTVFAVRNAEPIQQILPPQPLSLPFVDLRALPQNARKEEAERLAQEEAERPFDLAQDLMIRSKILCLEDGVHLLLLTIHHIASDRWSFTVLSRELEALYGAFSAGRASPLPALTIQYVDYAIWEREALRDTLYANQLQYWRKQLTEAPSELILTPDRLRPEHPVYAGACHSVTLSLPIREALCTLAQENGCSLYMVLLASFHLLLRFHSGQERVVTGTNVANRTHVELEGLIGFFINQIVLCSDLSGNPTFREFLGRVREVVLQGYAHQEVPFDLVLAEQEKERSLLLTPLFQILFVQNTPIPPLERNGLTILPPEFDTTTSKFDLAVFAEETASGIQFTWLYKTDLFLSSTIAKMADQFEVLLGVITATPNASLEELTAVLVLQEREKQRAEQDNRERSSRMRFESVQPKSVRMN